MTKLIEARTTERAIHLTFDDATSSGFPFFWLRDHAQDDESWDHRSHQREFFTAAADPEIAPVDVHLDADGANLMLSWPDQNGITAYPAGFLYRFAAAATGTSPARHIWAANSLDTDDLLLTWQEIAGNDALTESGQARLLETIYRFGFAVLDGVPVGQESVAAVARSIGYVRETIFGGLWEFAANEGMDDSAYTPKELRPHTDGTYSHDAPGLQLLLCCEYDAEGGDSIMVDGFAIHQWMQDHHPDALADLTRIHVPGQYIGDGVILRTERPIFRLDPHGDLAQVSFNNYDRAPFRLNDDDMARFYAASRLFDQKANDPSMQWRQILRPGQMLIFDNWRILHGRAAFRGHRKMAGCYLNREDYESSLRRAGLRN